MSKPNLQNIPIGPITKTEVCDPTWLNWFNAIFRFINALGTRFLFNNSVQITTGVGDPNGVITAPVGSMYLRSDGGAGSTLYIKESGVLAVGWVAK